MDVNITAAIDGLSALAWAAAEGRSSAAVAMLLSHPGTRVNSAPEGSGITSLHYACIMWFPSVPIARYFVYFVSCGALGDSGPAMHVSLSAYYACIVETNGDSLALTSKSMVHCVQVLDANGHHCIN